MTDLACTEERRAELAELLRDVKRLRAEFPKVADYLDTAPMLSGTGDERADAAFDLRLIHYLTGGRTETGNPYWEIVGPLATQRPGRRVVDGGRPQGSPRLGYAQTILQSVYAYAIPSPETLRWMTDVCGGRPIVELGAGRGYWAAQLAALGLDVDAYDSEPPDKAVNVSFPCAAGQRDTWYRVQDLNGYRERVRGRGDHVLFMCWPPGWENAMASEALAEFQHAGGERLVFIGEPKGGKTGDTTFFDALETDWRMESQDPQYVSWWNLSDVAQAWDRR